MLLDMTGEGTASAGTLLGFDAAAVGAWGTPTTGGFTGSLLRYRAARGFGGSSCEREEQLVSGAEGAARDETDRIDSSVSSRMWCRDASGGCDFRERTL